MINIRYKLLLLFVILIFAFSTISNPIFAVENEESNAGEQIDTEEKLAQQTSPSENLEADESTNVTEQEEIDKAKQLDFIHIKMEDKDEEPKTLSNVSNDTVALARTPQIVNFDDLVASGKIISPKVTYQNGNSGHSQPLDGSTIFSGTSEKVLNVAINVEDSFEIVEGDTFIFNLPQDLQFNYVNPPNGTAVTTPGGIAFAQLFLQGDVLKLIFNDYFEDKTDRYFYFKMQVSITAAQSLEGQQMTFNLFSQAYTLNVIQQPPGSITNPYFTGHTKDALGVPRSEGHGRIGWELRINYDASLTMRNVAITDILPPGLELATDLNTLNLSNSPYSGIINPARNVYLNSFVLQAWTPTADVEGPYTNTPKLHDQYCKLDPNASQIAADKKSFKLVLTEINEKQCYIYFETKLINEDDISLPFTNTATITENGAYVSDITKDNVMAYNMSTGGGAATVLYTVNVTKTDGDTNQVITSPAKFKLVRSDGVMIPEQTTVNGVATFTNVPKGTYSIIETQAPAGYGKALAQTIVLPQAGQTSTVYAATVKNYGAGSIIVQKVIKGTTTPIQDVTVFRVKQFTEDGVTLVNSSFYPTNSQGVLTLTGLARGIYKIEEVSPPVGYVRSAEVLEIIIGNNNGQMILDHEKNFENEKRLGNLMIKKVDELVGTNPLQGAIFKVIGPNNYEQTMTTDIFGIAAWSNLQPGTYTVTEEQPPLNYDKTVQPFNVIVGYNASDPDIIATTTGITAYTHELTVSNRIKPITSVILSKVDSVTGIGLDGVLFDLHKYNPATNTYEVIQSDIVTANGGIIKIEGYRGEAGLEYGDYQFVEKTPLPHYYNLVAPIDFKIDANNLTFTKTVANVKKPETAIKVVKIDADTNFPLEGVKFNIQKWDVASSEYVNVKTGLLTNNDGIVEWKGYLTEGGPEYGKYRFVETEPLANYASTDAVEIEIDAANPQKALDVKNTKLGQFILTKVDEDDRAKVLAGVTFKLERLIGADYTVIDAALVTNANGQISKTNLLRGQYRLTEVSTLNDYELNETPIIFEVEYNQDVSINTSLINGKALQHEFIFINQLEPLVPPNVLLPESLQEKIDEIKDYVNNYDDTIIPAPEIKQKAMILYDEYEVLEPVKQELVEEQINVVNLKKIAEYQYATKPPSKLPQTNAMNLNTLSYLGFALMVISIFTVIAQRRRRA